MPLYYKLIYECDRCGKLENQSKTPDPELAVHRFRPKGWVCTPKHTYCSDCALAIIQKKRERKMKEKQK